MKKILCIIESLGSGGAERQMVGLAALLKGKGYDVTVLTYYPNSFYKHVLDEAGVTYEYYSKAQSKTRRIFALRKRIKQVNPDTVISYMETASVVACVIRLLGVKYNLIVSERNTTQKIGLQDRMRFFLYRWANWIVPNSYMQESFLLSHYGNLKPKIKTITNFVDTDFFAPVDTDKSETCRMLCVSRLTAQKNILRFLDAVKRLKEQGISLTIDWIGNNRTEYAKECMAKTNELGISDVIRFLGEKSDIRAEYQSHDVLCLPSLYEGFPNVVCEAMSCGLPIVCSNVCDNPRIVLSEDNGFLFDPSDVDAIVDAIKKFISLDDEKKKQIRYNNRLRAVDLFSPSIFINSYISLIEQ